MSFPILVKFEFNLNLAFKLQLIKSFNGDNYDRFNNNI